MRANLTLVHIEFYCQDKLLAVIEASNETILEKTKTNLTMTISVQDEELFLLLENGTIYTADSYVVLEVYEIEIIIPVQLKINLVL